MNIKYLLLITGVVLGLNAQSTTSDKVSPRGMNGFTPYFQSIKSSIRNMKNALLESFKETSFDVDMYKSDGELIIHAAIPGVAAQDITIKVADTMLHIEAHRQEQKETQKKDFYKQELAQTSFDRKLTLPHPVDAARGHAELSQGILTVHLPLIRELKDKDGTAVQAHTEGTIKVIGK